MTTKRMQPRFRLNSWADKVHKAADAGDWDEAVNVLRTAGCKLPNYCVSTLVKKACNGRAWSFLRNAFDVEKVGDVMFDFFVDLMTQSGDEVEVWRWVSSFSDSCRYETVPTLLKRSLMCNAAYSEEKLPTVMKFIANFMDGRNFGYCRSVDPESERWFQELFECLEGPDFIRRWDSVKLMRLLVVMEKTGHSSSTMAVLLAAIRGVLNDFINKLHKEPTGLSGGLSTLFSGAMYVGAWKLAARVLQEDLNRRSFKYRSVVYRNVLSRAIPRRLRPTNTDDDGDPESADVDDVAEDAEEMDNDDAAGAATDTDSEAAEPANIDIFVQESADSAATAGGTRTLDTFLDLCRENGWYAAGALTALWSGCCNGMRMIAQEKSKRCVNHVKEQIVRGLRNRCVVNWKMTLDILRERKQQKNIDKLLTIALDYSDHDFNRCPLPVIEELMILCQDKKVLKQIWFESTILKDMASFRRCVQDELIALNDRYVFHEHSLLVLVIRLLAGTYRGDKTKRLSQTEIRNSLRTLLRKCIEAGMTTDSTETPWISNMEVTPLYAAAYYGALDLVKLMFKTGAVSNAELHRLNSNKLVRVLLAGLRLRGMQRYLDTVCSSPRCLEDLCRLAVSRMIGCGVDRKHKALCLGLPVHIVSKILFFDVLYQ